MLINTLVEKLGFDKQQHLGIDVASGKLTKAKKMKQDDFIPWKRGMLL